MTLDPVTDPLQTVTQVAKIFQVRPYTVRQWLADGKMQGVKINDRWRVPQSEIVRFANERHG